MRMIKVSGNFQLSSSPDSASKLFSRKKVSNFIIEKRDVPFQIKNFSFPLTWFFLRNNITFFSSRLPRAFRLAMFQKNRTLVFLSSPFEHDYEKTAPGLKIAIREYENVIDVCVWVMGLLLCIHSEKSRGKCMTRKKTYEHIFPPRLSRLNSFQVIVVLEYVLDEVFFGDHFVEAEKREISCLTVGLLVEMICLHC